MKLYIGGTGSGQDILAKKENPENIIIYDFHNITKDVLENGGSAQEYAKKLIDECPDAVVICDEIGLGIHPLDPFERLWREETGRALCILAEFSESVIRVTCGIGQRIK
ncbi:MAG: bifunctional adenosylcobinamide kinase/adenosylcobinamide-phosphate guanylyltransferase [Bacillota bacterium]|nr:bifunctional adenosylcobinamide kinase/adenosylcobinamide-phosphate guanylyltransferase [Bacillota bacterium]